MNLDNDTGRAWIDALLHGNYPQIGGTLHTKHGFCALGLLCEVAKDELGWEWTDYDGYTFVYGDTSSGLPPEEVKDLLDMTDYEAADIARYNDRYGCSFPEIADYLKNAEHSE